MFAIRKGAASSKWEIPKMMPAGTTWGLGKLSEQATRDTAGKSALCVLVSWVTPPSLSL